MKIFTEGMTGVPASMNHDIKIFRSRTVNFDVASLK